MSVYYNDIDPNARAWTAELMKRGFIPPGDIDDRSIEFVQPGDVAGYTQCHFFCGISVWAYAAIEAGWPENRPLWTGSCPCQPFSVSGKRRGTADRRHLWPHLFRLIRACRPPVVMGEQVAQKAGWNWFDGVRADLAGEAYQCRGIGLCSCAVDSPDERERIYWCAVAQCGDAGRGRRQLQRPGQGQGQNGERTSGQFARRDGGECGSMVNDTGLGRGEGRPEPILHGGRGTSAGADAPCAMGNGDRTGLPLGQGIAGDARPERQAAERADGAAEQLRKMAYGHRSISQARDSISVGDEPARSGSLVSDGRNGSWYTDHEWIDCHDGKKRRAKPGTSMLVAGSPGRIPMWRGLGGSINAQLATEVIKTFLETQA